MIKRRYHVIFHPVLVERREGASTVRQIRDGLRALHTILRVLILFHALRAFNLLATLLISVGMIYGVTTAALVGIGFPVLAAVIVLAGVQVFCIGVVCDQISALRMERIQDRVEATEADRSVRVYRRTA